MSSRTLALSLAALTAACSNAPPPTCHAPAADPAAVSTLETGNLTFALNLFGQLAGDGGGNLVVSPFSVSNALAMAEVGADGGTAAEVARTLGLPAPVASAPPAFAQLSCGLETDGDVDGNQLLIADALFGQIGATLEPAFTSTLSTDFAAPLQLVDFTNDDQAAVDTINTWVSTQTKGLIPTIVSLSDVPPGTPLVLVNALYFKGVWSNGFDASKTAPAAFSTGASTQIQVPTMNASNFSIGLAAIPGGQVGELAYKGGRLAMDIVLPTAVDGLAALEATVTPSALAGWLAALQTEAVTVALPKLSLSTQVELIPTLQALGIRLAFEPGADFSGIDGADDLSIQGVIHDAVMQVDESGTVAAAATAVVFASLSAGPPATTFIVDHPFLVLLRDVPSNTVLFVAQVTNPAG